jgi:hypothetical protein
MSGWCQGPAHGKYGAYQSRRGKHMSTRSVANNAGAANVHANMCYGTIKAEHAAKFTITLKGKVKADE